MIPPQNWLEDERGTIAEAVAEGIVRDMTLEQMRARVLDDYYDDLVNLDWSELWWFAERYAPELVDQFRAEGVEVPSY